MLASLFNIAKQYGTEGILHVGLGLGASVSRILGQTTRGLAPLGASSPCSYCRQDAKPAVIVEKAEDAEQTVVVENAKEAVRTKGG